MNYVYEWIHDKTIRWGAEDELKSLKACGKNLFCSVVEQQWILLYCLADGSI